MRIRMRTVLVVVSLGVLACGGGNQASAPATTNPDAASAVQSEPAAMTPSETPAVAAESESGADEPLRTISAAQMPDPCKLLTAEDATELLGGPVGPPQSPDAGGYPCIYRGQDGKSLIALDMSLARGSSVEDTQLARSFEYCQAEKVSELEDLGREAAFFHMKKADCGSDTLWVSTGVYFEATEPDMAQGYTPKGWIHFSFSMRPAPDQATEIQKLSTAARRALERLPE